MATTKKERPQGEVIELWFPVAAAEIDMLIDDSEAATALASNGLQILRDKKGRIAGVSVPNTDLMLNALCWFASWRWEMIHDEMEFGLGDSERNEMNAYRRLADRLLEYGAIDSWDDERLES